MVKYVSKKDCVESGFIKTEKGIYKMSLLERYYNKGWLDLGNERYSAKDRLSAAAKLREDYEMSRFFNATSTSYREKVDGGNMTGILEIDVICEARERYFAAIKTIPEEFLSVVKNVCLEGKEPKLPSDLPERRKLELIFSLRRDLCRGLDRLVGYYLL